MKRLFTVRASNGATTGGFFESKQEAKEWRKQCNGTNKEGKENLSTGCTIMLGPDHRHYTGDMK